MLGSASSSLTSYPVHPPAANEGLMSLVPDLILGPRKALDFGELQLPGRRGTTRFFGTMSKVSMDGTASAIKPGRRCLNRTSMDVRRARGAIKDPSGAECHDVMSVHKKALFLMSISRSADVFYVVFVLGADDIAFFGISARTTHLKP